MNINPTTLHAHTTVTVKRYINVEAEIPGTQRALPNSKTKY